MARGELGFVDGQSKIEHTEGIWHFDDDDWALFAMLQDPIHCAELLFKDPKQPRLRRLLSRHDYQYPLFRHDQQRGQAVRALAWARPRA
jgi:hypothetical protein